MLPNSKSVKVLVVKDGEGQEYIIKGQEYENSFRATYSTEDDFDFNYDMNCAYSDEQIRMQLESAKKLMRIESYKIVELTLSSKLVEAGLLE